MDPYEILGLKYPCTKEEVKARYYELARKHHPDKLQHLSQEERDKNEQEFKKINVAYELLSKKEFEYTTKTEWKDVWSSFDSMFGNQDMLRNMGELLKNVVQATREYKKQKSAEHHISVEVSMEEVHTRKEKKLRLFLKNIEEPVFITIDCGCYPSFVYTHILPSGRTIFIHLEFILKTHPVYSIDTVFETNSLYMTQKITLYDYVRGSTQVIKYLDGTDISIIVPAFSIEPIDIPSKGLFGKGTLTIYIEVVLPTKMHLEKLSEKKRAKLHKYLKDIYDPPQNGVKMI